MVSLKKVLTILVNEHYSLHLRGFSTMQDDSSSGSSYNVTISSDSSTSCDENNLTRTYRTRNRSENVKTKKQKETKEVQNISSSSENDSNESDLIFLPGDPREWESEHIEQLLNWATKQFKIDPELQKEKFPKTGKELCAMTRADFWVCAGTKYGAEKLAKYLAHSMYKVTGEWDMDLLSDDDPSK